MSAGINDRVDRAAIVASARSEWPDVQLPAERFLAYLGDRWLAGTDADQLHTGDLFLACACLEGDRAALAAFDEVLGHAAAHTRRIDPSPAFTDEVKQLLRQQLLLGERPRLATYAGRGPLGAWLRMAAVRVALNLRRGERSRATAERAVPPPQVGVLSPDLLLLVERARPHVEAALREALAQLDAVDRLLLRLRFGEGINATRLGKLLGLDRTTAARRARAAREQVLEEVRRQVATRLELTESSAHSLLRVVRSQLHVSLSQVGEQAPDTG